MTEPIAEISPGRTTTSTSFARHDALRAQATQLEAFLFAELLRVSDTGKASLLGDQESQFQSLLRDQQAQAVAGSGQTGLAEAIYKSLAKDAGLGS